MRERNVLHVKTPLQQAKKPHNLHGEFFLLDELLVNVHHVAHAAVGTHWRHHHGLGLPRLAGLDVLFLPFSFLPMLKQVLFTVTRTRRVGPPENEDG